MLECSSDSTEMPWGSRTPRTKRCEFEGCTEVFAFETIEQYVIMLQIHKEAVHPTTNQYSSMDESTRRLQLLTDTSEKDWSRFESKFKQYRLICELEGEEVIGHRIVGGRANSKVRKDVLGSARMNLEKCIKYIKEMEYGCSRKDFTDKEVIIDGNQQESGCSPCTSNDPEQNEQLSKGKRKSRAPDSHDITKRKKDNLAERKQGDKAKVRSKVNNGAGKRRLGTPDSCNEEKARQKRERLNLNMRICRLNAKLRAEKVKDSIIHMRKERKNIEERIKPLLHSMVYLKDTLFSHTGSNHEINFLSEQTSYIVEVNKPAPIIDTPHDVPRIEIKREKGKQYSKDELEKLRRNKAQKVRNYNKKVSRENDQLELEKLQLQLQTLPLEEQQMKVAKKTIRAESARIINGSLTKEAWEEFIERTFAHVKNCSLNASCNLSVKWPLDPRICEYVGVSYPEDLQSEVQVSSLSGQQASTKLSLQ